jgi:hypothetical protein
MFTAIRRALAGTYAGRDYDGKAASAFDCARAT